MTVVDDPPFKIGDQVIDIRENLSEGRANDGLPMTVFCLEDSSGLGIVWNVMTMWGEGPPMAQSCDWFKVGGGYNDLKLAP